MPLSTSSKVQCRCNHNQISIIGEKCHLMNKDIAHFSSAQELVTTAHIYIDHPSISQRPAMYPALDKIMLGINDSSATISPYPPTMSKFLFVSLSDLFHYATLSTCQCCIMILNMRALHLLPLISSRATACDRHSATVYRLHRCECLH